jgi:hypothetical protein
MNAELALAAEKLHKTECPILIQPDKYRILSLRKEATELSRLVSKSLEPVEAPSRVKRALSFLGKKVGIERIPAPAILEAKLKALQETLASLEKKSIEAILVPLTLADEGVGMAYYYKTRRHLAASLTISVASTPEATELEDQAREEAINFGSNHYHRAKLVELVTRKRVDGKLVPCFTEREAHALDMRLTAEIMDEHQKAFQLTDDDLGKSQAPSKAA